MFRDFFKENLPLVAAIVLPLCLVLIFMASQAIVTFGVEDPKYDFLVTDQYRDNQDVLLFEVVEDRLRVTYRHPWRNKDNHTQLYDNQTRLYRVSAKDMSVKEINIPRPARIDDLTEPKSEILDIPELKNIKISNMQPSPDGYSYEESSYRNGGNLMTELFSYRSSYSPSGIVKEGRRIPIKNFRGHRYSNNTSFIGWIVE